jgi:hypothetical protein
MHLGKTHLLQILLIHDDPGKFARIYIGRTIGMDCSAIAIGLKRTYRYVQS